MNKAEYFDQLHERLGKEFGISPKAVETIRSFALGPQKLTRGQIIIWVKEKLATAGIQKATKEKRMHECSFCKHIQKENVEEVVPSHKRDVYSDILSFMQKAEERNWKDMVFPYQFTEKPKVTGREI